jgi:L-methionine (R)-S-oxide reductase
MPNYQVLLQEFESLSRSSADVKSLMQQLAQRLHEKMARYNWVGFYVMEPPTFDALVLGPYAGSFMPTLRIPLNKGLCGAAASSGKTVVVNNVSEDPRYLGSDLVKANIVVPILAKNQVIAELCIESYFADTFNHAEQEFIESCAAVVQNAIRKYEFSR